MPDFDQNQTNDGRRYAPATKRNQGVIKDVLSAHLTDSGTLLELASGTGEHAAALAHQFPDYDWQPSDYDTHNLTSIDAWRKASQAPNILPVIRLDVMKDRWPVEVQLPTKKITAILAINLIHISPWEITTAVIGGAARILKSGGLLYFYGPYKVSGEHTSESNVQFDGWLKSQDAGWGVRNMDEVIAIATSYGFGEPEITPMPANNFSLAFKKRELFQWVYPQGDASILPTK